MPPLISLTAYFRRMDDLITQTLTAWRINNAVLLFLVDNIPPKGFAAVPTGSRGRDVAAQLFHMNRVREAWLQYFRTGRRPRLEKFDKARRPTKAQLKRALTASGKDVERFLGEALRGEARVRMFGSQPLRWMCYLIAHDAHHRGSILLALKQCGMRMKEDVSIEGVWGKWFSAKGA